MRTFSKVSVWPVSEGVRSVGGVEDESLLSSQVRNLSAEAIVAAWAFVMLIQKQFKRGERKK